MSERAGFPGRVDSPRVDCTTPGYERGRMCRYPWWTMFIRLGTLWKCPKCGKVSILEWIEDGGWGMKSWFEYKPEGDRG